MENIICNFEESFWRLNDSQYDTYSCCELNGKGDRRQEDKTTKTQRKNH